MYIYIDTLHIHLCRPVIDDGILTPLHFFYLGARDRCRGKIHHLRLTLLGGLLGRPCLCSRRCALSLFYAIRRLIHNTKSNTHQASRIVTQLDFFE